MLQHKLLSSKTEILHLPRLLHLLLPSHQAIHRMTRLIVRVRVVKDNHKKFKAKRIEIPWTNPKLQKTVRIYRIVVGTIPIIQGLRLTIIERLLTLQQLLVVSLCLNHRHNNKNNLLSNRLNRVVHQLISQLEPRMKPWLEKELVCFQLHPSDLRIWA